MRFATTLSLCGTLAFALVAPYSLTAQVANASVSAEVQQPITVTKTRDLDFELVFPGVNKTVAVVDVTSASFTIAGQASAQVHVSFTLPSTLTSGINTMPIDTWTARHNTTNTATGGTDFSPSPSSTQIALSGTGALYLFVGATVEPTITQAAGTYTGTITVTVEYQ